MDTNFLSQKAHVRAGATGSATYALQPIAAGETVAAFGGRCMTAAALNELAANERAHCIQIDDNVFMVGEIGDMPGDTINHSCQPNCGIVGGVLVVAMRDIAIGEALSYDYAMSAGCDVNDFVCACGAAACRRSVTGNDWMLPELQLRYRGYFSPFLAKRIAALVRTGAERRAFAY